jgi:acyl-CoA thioester hydrolase
MSNCPPQRVGVSDRSAGFVWKARVYWEDTDGGGIVYYANYLKYLERARTEWLRSLGQSQSEQLRERGLAFTVIQVNVEYHRPARLDDELTITVGPERIGGTVVRFNQSIHRVNPQDLLVTAQVRVACIDMRTMRPTRLPAYLTQEIFAT